MENYHVTKFNQVVKDRVIVFIDAANLEQSVKRMRVYEKDVASMLPEKDTTKLLWSVDYSKLRDFFSKIKGFVGIRFYTADFSSNSYHKFLYFLDKELDFKLITKPMKEYKDHKPEMQHRKANFDVEIAVDSIFTIDKFDTAIFFSGDCDFEYLVKFLRGHGKIVLGFSRSGNVARELLNSYSYYFDIVDFRHEFLKIINKTRKTPDLSVRGSAVNIM